MDNKYLSLDDFKKKDSYNNFISSNPSNGTLKVQVFTADQAIPIANTKVFVSKNIDGEDVLFFEGVTDNSGIVDNISLPAPTSEHDLEKYEEPKFTTYDLVVSNELYKNGKKYSINIFGDVKILQYVRMRLLEEDRYGY